MIAVDGLQQSVALVDSAHGNSVNVAQLTIAFTGTTFDMDRFPDRTPHSSGVGDGVTNGNLLHLLVSY